MDIEIRLLEECPELSESERYLLNAPMLTVKRAIAVFSAHTYLSR